MNGAVKKKIKDYILNEFLPGEDPDELKDTTPLITGGIIDSIGTLKLVMFLEEEYKIKFAPHEIDRDKLDTLAGIVNVVMSKNPKVA